jgi:hypothetical protein
MAVPKKRKKLAETSESLKKSIPEQQKTKKARKAERISMKNSTKKIDNAFEIMKHIEDDDFPEDETPSRSDSTRERKLYSSSSKSKQQGFRFRISLDALIPDKKSQDEDLESAPISRSHLLDIGVTIPFFWRFPIIGGIAQKVVRSIKTIKF